MSTNNFSELNGKTYENALLKVVVILALRQFKPIHEKV